MDKLLKEAIADAKAVRETAIANAKLALEEAFTPKLQSMLSAKIREEDDAEVEDEETPVDTAEEGDVYSAGEEDAVEAPADDAEVADAEEDIAGEDEMGGEDEMRGSSEDMHGEDEGMRGEDEGMRGEDEMRGADEMDSEDEMRGADERDHSDEEGHSEEPTADDTELDEIIKELEAEMDSEEEMDTDDEMRESSEVTEQSDSSDIGKGDNKVDVADGDDYEKAETEKSSKAPGTEGEDTVVNKLTEEEGGDEEKDEEPVDLEEIIKSLSEDQYTAGVDDNEAGDSVENPESPVDPTENKKLKEAYATIKFMKNKLNEVNLLNAKLLFANKLFRGNTLDEGQKLRVIETFDRAGSVREVKLVYSTLSESLRYDAKARKPQAKKITEGLASKASKTTKPASKTVISEGTVMANRFKKLAGLIK